MNPITYALRLDAAQGGSQAAIVVKRYDIRSRLLRMRLYHGTTPWPFEAGMVATLRAVKPDGMVIYNDCDVAGGAAETLISPQMLAVAGAVACELCVYDAAGEALTSPKFDLYVEDLLYPDDAIMSGDEFSALTGAMTRLAALEADVEDGEGLREMSEEARQRTEAEREAAEAQRVTLYDLIRLAYESGAFIGPVGGPGPRGEPGLAAMLEIIRILTGEPGTEAAVEEAEDSTAQHRRYILTVPEGRQGQKGDAGNVQYATFHVDTAGLLVMETPDGYAGPVFRVVNGMLEVTVGEGNDHWLPIGRVAALHAGDWAAGQPYGRLTEIGYDGSTYRAGEDIPAGTRPGADARWILIARRGLDGSMILGRFDTLAALQAAHPEGTRGDMYAVGTAASNVIYVWDVEQRAWTDIGPTQGPPGETGLDAAVAIVQTLTGPPGTAATITEAPDSGPQNRKYILTVPRGATGAAGGTGATGGAGPIGPAGPGLLAGGADGQFLVKDGAADYATRYVTGAAAMVGAVPMVSGKADPAATSAAIVQVTASKTLSLADAGTLQCVDSTGAVTLTVPQNAAVAFPVGTEIEAGRMGAGDVTFVAASGVTFLCAADTYRISARYGAASLKQVAPDVWWIAGGVG